MEHTLDPVSPLSPQDGAPIPTRETVAALALTGTLRVGINTSNFLLVSNQLSDGTPVGVSPSMATTLADVLGVPVHMVTFPDPGALVDAVAAGEVDVGNVGADPTRGRHMSFTQPYSEIDATYLVPAGSPIETIVDVDRAGVRIATRARAAYTLWLERSIENAELVPADSLDAALDVFLDRGLEVLAGLRPRLLDDVDRVPGGRLLEGRFTSVQQAIGIHRDRPAEALVFLGEFVRWAIESGLVARLIEEHGVKGLSVAAVDVG